jgi:hypothetical protein
MAQPDWRNDPVQLEHFSEKWIRFSDQEMLWIYADDLQNNAGPSSSSPAPRHHQKHFRLSLVDLDDKQEATWSFEPAGLPPR